MTDIVLRKQELGELQALASILVDAHFFKDVQTQAQAAAKVIAGRELGLGPMEAMRSFHVVDGKVEMSADLLAQRVKAHEKYDYTVAEIEDDHCSIIFWQDGEEIGTSTFTMKDRERAGISLTSREGKPSTWAKYPRNMLFARALSNGVAWFCPDVAGGGGRLYVEGEISGDEPELPPAELPQTAIDAATGETVDTVTGEVIDVEASEGGLDRDRSRYGEGRGDSEGTPSEDVPVTPAEPESTESVGEKTGGGAPTTTEPGGDSASPPSDEDSTEPSGSVARATVKQKQKLAILAGELGWDDDERHRQAGVASFSDLTKEAATALTWAWTEKTKHDHVWKQSQKLAKYAICTVEGCLETRRWTDIEAGQEALA